MIIIKESAWISGYIKKQRYISLLFYISLISAFLHVPAFYITSFFYIVRFVFLRLRSSKIIKNIQATTLTMIPSFKSGA